jgi:hypothetical protein
MKILLTITFLLLAVSSMGAQTSNVHAALTITGTSNLGFHNPIIGASGGGDLRKGKLVLSGDLNLDRIIKNVGGHGFQLSGRETVRYYLSKFFVQGGAVEQHYSVAKFSKSTFEPLIGVGYADKSYVLQANYRHDLSSQNRQRIIEGVATFYGRHHLFVRPSIAVSRYRSGGKSLTGTALSIGIGVWK